MNRTSAPAPSVTITMSRVRAEKLVTYARLRRVLCYDPRPAGEWFHEINEQALAVMETMTDADVAPLAADQGQGVEER